MAELKNKILTLRQDIISFIMNELMPYNMQSPELQQVYIRKLQSVVESLNTLTELAFMIQEDVNDQLDLNIGMTE
jgi:hypothetical protein